MLDKKLQIRPLFPNAVTMLALAFGVSSINMAFWGHWQVAILFLALSAFFDFMDGKVARLLHVESKFGAELDSLSDFVSFGVAPGFLMYQWTMDPAVRIDVLSGEAMRADAVGVPWGFALFLAMCCATRLARFNTMLDEKRPPYWTHFFMGVPAPAGAGLALLPLIFWLATGWDFLKNPSIVAFFLLFAGIMMASRIPTFCLKHIHIPSKYYSIFPVAFIFLITSVVAFPWALLSFLGIAYVISIPVGIYYFCQFRNFYLNKRG